MLLQLLGIEGSQPRQLPSLPTPQPFQQQRQHSSLKKSCTCCPHNQHSLLISGATSASVGGVSAADGAHFQHEAAQTEAVLFRCGSAIPQSVWRSFWGIIGGNCHKYDLSRQNYTHTHKTFVATNTCLARQNICRDKKIVATKIRLVAAPANDIGEDNIFPSSWPEATATQNASTRATI